MNALVSTTESRALLLEIQRTALVSSTEAKQIAHELSKLSNLIKWLAPQFAPFDFQSEFIDDNTTRWKIIKKPRQVGMSMNMAQKRYGIAQAVPRYGALFISLNMDDAQEKIAYALELHEAMSQMVPVSPLINQNKTELLFANGSRLKAVFTPRGKSRMDIDWDEAAHSSCARKVYRAALPIMTLGGQLTIASSVLHSGTLFNQIWDQDDGKYKHYKRVTIHWWDCPLHCCDIATARMLAPDMSTADRVQQFGTPILIEIYENMLEEDFQMEYEGRSLDDDTALLPWDLIVSCSPTGEDAIRTFDSLEEIIEWSTKGEIKSLYAGYDVGRRRDSGELSVFVQENESGLFERYTQTFDRESFQTQQDTLDFLCSHSNVRLVIDETGMGMQMAEYLEDQYGDDQVIKMSFTNDSKAAMATALKKYMVQGKVKFKADKDANFQMHSIKKDVTAAGRIVYNVKAGEHEDTKRHHADKFWARALGIWGHAERETAGPTEIRFFE